MVYLAEYPIADRTSDREREHRLGRTLLAGALMREYGIHYQEEMVITGANGKPYLRNYPDIYFNISHARGAVVCVVHGSEVGIDIEPVRPCAEGLARRILTQREHAQVQLWTGQGMSREEALIRFWTLKESYAKACGLGLSLPFREAEFIWEPDGVIREAGGAYLCSQTKVFGIYIISLCAQTE